jgi:hypothetical protein
MRVITLNVNKKVISLKNVGSNYVLGVNDIESDTGELDQILQSDGTFITPDPVVIEPIETIEQKVARQEEQIAELNLQDIGMMEMLIERGLI